MKRKTRNKIILWVLMLTAAAVLVGGTIALVLTAGTWKAKIKESHEKVCDKGWECSNSKYCCNDTITDFFKVYQFENLFSKRNTPVAKAVGFWDYQSFILAAALYEPLGFCTTGGKEMQMRELCAFLGHVGAATSCKHEARIGWLPFLAWSGLTGFELTVSLPLSLPQVGSASPPVGRWHGDSATTAR
jgi:hypothetical protein